MLAVPAPKVKVKLSIDGVPVETVQVGTSEVYDRVDRFRERSIDYAVSDSAGYLDLVADRALEPGIHHGNPIRSRAVTRSIPICSPIIVPGTCVGV